MQYILILNHPFKIKILQKINKKQNKVKKTKSTRKRSFQGWKTMREVRGRKEPSTFSITSGGTYLLQCDKPTQMVLIISYLKKFNSPDDPIITNLK